MDLTQIEKALGCRLNLFTNEKGVQYLGGFLQMPSENHTAFDTVKRLNTLTDAVQQLLSLGTHSLARCCAEKMEAELPEKWCVSAPESGVALRYEKGQFRTEYVGAGHKPWPQEYYVFFCIPIEQMIAQEIAA